AYESSMIPSASPASSAFTPAGFRSRALSVLRPPPGEADRGMDDHRGPSDFDLNPELPADFGRSADARAAMAAGRPIRPAAVLIPVLARPSVTLLFTLRSNDLPSHAGQIAFPGGKAEPFDANPLATALREAHEEIGLDASFV